MRSQRRITVALAAFLLAAPVLSGAEPVPQIPRLPQEDDVGVIDDTRGSLPQVTQENGISYVSGGVGSDEADVLNRMSERFNLKLTMSVPSGQFTNPSQIRIENAGGAQVIQVRPNGPIFLAKLPAGEYVVQATAEGQTLTRKVTVPVKGLEAIAMRWPAASEPVRAGDAPE
jgi:hypothetical protein